MPPRVPHVFDGTGRELVDTAGPYLLGTVTSLKCVVDGGKTFFSFKGSVQENRNENNSIDRKKTV